VDSVKPETPVELPSPKQNIPVKPFEEQYRGFNDDFSLYKIVTHLIPVPSLSYEQSKVLKKIGNQFDESMIKFVKNGMNESSGSMLDAEDLFLESIADFLFPSLKDVVFNDKSVSRPTLFRSCKDLYSFLLGSGTNSELKLSLGLLS
jgi:hypothetical protein